MVADCCIIVGATNEKGDVGDPCRGDKTLFGVPTAGATVELAICKSGVLRGREERWRWWLKVLQTRRPSKKDNNKQETTKSEDTNESENENENRTPRTNGAQDETSHPKKHSASCPVSPPRRTAFTTHADLFEPGSELRWPVGFASCLGCLFTASSSCDRSRQSFLLCAPFCCSSERVGGPNNNSQSLSSTRALLFPYLLHLSSLPFSYCSFSSASRLARLSRLFHSVIPLPPGPTTQRRPRHPNTEIPPPPGITTTPHPT